MVETSTIGIVIAALVVLCLCGCLCISLVGGMYSLPKNKKKSKKKKSSNEDSGIESETTQTNEIKGNTTQTLDSKSGAEQIIKRGKITIGGVDVSGDATTTANAGGAGSDTKAIDGQDCVLFASSEWGDCSKECGGGTQTRNNTISTQASTGGTKCPPTLESRECNTQNC
jgi:hypothetical protein